MDAANATLDRIFREEYGWIIATLIRISGSFDLAEESLQEAFALASARWPAEGTPRNPGAWLTTVSHRKLLDSVRRQETHRNKQPELEYELESSRELGDLHPTEADVENQYPDDRLRLIFTCCHPSLSPEAQVALTLRTLGGLTTTEIAHAFLLPEPTLAQRLVRAKNKIRLAGIPYEIPSVGILGERLAAVQAVIYLVFNEGYAASGGQELVRHDLCAEAIRLGRLLCQLSPDEPENLGLLGLMLLQDSRRNARTDQQGELVTLEEQNRSLWNREQIAEGVRLVETALSRGHAGSYQIQAAIAAVHSEARTAEETDWDQIVALYNELMRVNSSPVVALNRAAAVAMSDSIEAGLKLIENLGAAGTLDQYYLFHAAQADLLRRLNRTEEAAAAYQRALLLTTNHVERQYLRKRLAEVTCRRGL
jgi:RNA polymerase sigma-70 factor (ECF subfamily)